MTAMKEVDRPRRNRNQPKRHMCELKEHARKQASKRNVEATDERSNCSQLELRIAVRDILSMRLTSDGPDYKNSQQDKLLNVCRRNADNAQNAVNNDDRYVR